MLIMVAAAVVVAVVVVEQLVSNFDDRSDCISVCVCVRARLWSSCLFLRDFVLSLSTRSMRSLLQIYRPFAYFLKAENSRNVCKRP